jgi:type II secretory pathway pseudopilin PulG
MSEQPLVRRRSPDDEWVVVLRPAYAAARARHANERADAYELAREDALEDGLSGPGLRMTDIDTRALAVWHQTWRGRHPSGAGNWDWPALVQRLPHRAAVLPVAIWHGNDLCGLVLGYASRRRANGSRHTVSLTHVERRPEPPDVPLRGGIISIAVQVALRYGLAIGARRLRLRNPDRKLLGFYESLGFEIAWKGETAPYCEREV